MNRIRIVPFGFLILAMALCMPLAVSAQWKIDTVITRSHCPAEPPGGGAIALTVSGQPGVYAYTWSNGASTAAIYDLVQGAYTVTIENGFGKDTTIVYHVSQWTCDPDPDAVFTPNADGVHDTWGIANAQYYPNMLVAVYNRWGQKMYESKGMYTPWDGRNMVGLPVDVATYFYLIYKDAADTKSGLIKGSVSIIR